MNKIGAFVLLIFFSLSANQLIGDFAPMRIANSWSYYYFHKAAETKTIDSINISISIQSIEVVGQDSIILLNISETGIINCTNTSLNYIDTIIIQNDSIKQSKYYRCHVNPFWHTHSIDSDSLKSILLGNDSVLFYEKEPQLANIFSGDSQYIQNIGLYHTFRYIGILAPDRQETRLLSYNGKEILQNASIRHYYQIKNDVPIIQTFCPYIYLNSNMVFNGILLNGRLSHQNYLRSNILIQRKIK